MSNAAYSVAALAAALNVPRTTVNDWLTRYESFIEATAVGKRKVYSGRTLAVLQEVAKLRDMGKTGAEIETALEGIVGVTPEIAPEKNTAAPTEKSPESDAVKQTAAAENDAQTQLPAVKKFEENAMELAAFIADLRKEQVQSRKRSRLTALMLLIVIIVLVAALGAAVQAVRMQFAERQLEAVRMQQTLEKLNKEFTAELKSMESMRQQERRIAEKNTDLLKNELKRLQKASADEVQRLTRQLAADREAMQKKLALQEKALKNKSEAERKLLLAKLAEIESDAAKSQMILRNELAAANKTLNELNKKLAAPPPAPAPVAAPAPDPAAASTAVVVDNQPAAVPAGAAGK